MPDVNVLNIQRMPKAEIERVKAISPSIRFTDAAGWFDGEIRETWPEFTSNRYVPPNANGEGTRAERDALLAEAEVVLGGWPFPLDLRARGPKLKWFHQRPAGASNLKLGDLWESDVTVTTSRGYGNTLPIAEYSVAVKSAPNQDAFPNVGSTPAPRGESPRRSARGPAALPMG